VCALAAGKAMSETAKLNVSNNAIAAFPLFVFNCIFSFSPVFILERFACIIIGL
jgi:hypothetical protein